MELHLSPKVVSKGAKGRTACGSAAYRSGSKIIDNDGVQHDFRYKKERVGGFVALPKGAPEELRDPQTLWQRHEKNDVRYDAQLYRDVETAVPNELSYDAALRIGGGIAEPLTDLGMCVQVDLHDKITYEDEEGHRVNFNQMIPEKNYIEIRNLHLHFMITMRELLPDGTFGKKNRTWNKFNGGLNIADLLRERAANLMNEELQKIGSEERVEHKSFAERGIDKIPTKHVGTAARAMESKGVVTDRETNRMYIQWLNKIHLDNLEQANKQARRLDSLIQKAENATNGTEVYRDWDAVFAYLRDIRRGRAAIAGELKRLDKVAAAYKSGEEKDKNYLRWAGCNPENPAQECTVELMRKDLRKHDQELATAEQMVMRYKGKLKIHNQTIYISNKIQWDEYQIQRKKQGINYFIRRTKNLGEYIRYIRKNISIWDVILNTDEYKAYVAKLDRLERERMEIHEKYSKMRWEIEQHQRDLKEHKREQKEILKEEKKTQKAERKKEDPTERF